MSSKQGYAPAAAQQADRAEERRARILQVATQLFLEQGYLSTSMDQIVQRLGGSKGTIYSHFPSKAEMFRAVIRSIVSGDQEPVLNPEEPVEHVLTAFADARLAIVSSSRHVALMRLVIAEQQRFPDIAEMYWEEGPETRRQTLASYLWKVSRRGGLVFDDPLDAADTFISLLMQSWYVRRICIPSTAPSQEALHEQARRAVSKFLALYGAAGSHG